MIKRKSKKNISTELTSSIELHANDWKWASWRFDAPSSFPEAPAFKLYEAQLGLKSNQLLQQRN